MRLDPDRSGVLVQATQQEVLSEVRHSVHDLRQVSKQAAGSIQQGNRHKVIASAGKGAAFNVLGLFGALCAASLFPSYSRGGLGGSLVLGPLSDPQSISCRDSWEDAGGLAVCLFVCPSIHLYPPIRPSIYPPITLSNRPINLSNQHPSNQSA